MTAQTACTVRYLTAVSLSLFSTKKRPAYDCLLLCPGELGIWVFLMLLVWIPSPLSYEGRNASLYVNLLGTPRMVKSVQFETSKTRGCPSRACFAISLSRRKKESLTPTTLLICGRLQICFWAREKRCFNVQVGAPSAQRLSAIIFACDSTIGGHVLFDRISSLFCCLDPFWIWCVNCSTPLWKLV